MPRAMNERVKALAVEADFMLCEDGHFYSEGQSQKITDALQKFAGLIIKDQGAQHMTKDEALQTLKMLSALESWSFSMKSPLPDYLHDNLTVAMDVLERIILESER